MDPARATQPALLGADATPPEPADLVALLIAGGDARLTDSAAQMSIIVTHPWRAAALVVECSRRGIAATSVSTPDDHIAVRTVHTPALRPLVLAWTDGSAARVTRGLFLDGRVLRLWVIARGEIGVAGYNLPLGDLDDPTRDLIGAALAAAGLPAALVAPPGGGRPFYRIVGRRRLRRLAELVGDPPKQAPPGSWPS